MILKASVVDNVPLLDAEDFGNLRLASHRMESMCTNAFGQRFLTSRKHMLSPRSLKGLKGIAANSVSASYVQELTIGPERIYHDLRRCKCPARQTDKAEWERDFGPFFDALLADQNAFVANDNDVASLMQSFQGLENLKKIHVAAFPDKRDQKAYREAWEANTILKVIGIDHFSDRPDWPKPNEALQNELELDDKLHCHYERIFGALRVIEDKED